MWYSGAPLQDVDRDYQMGHATSQDGINWTKDTNNPVLTLGPSGSWDDAWSAFGEVSYTDGAFKMWYSGWSG